MGIKPQFNSSDLNQIVKQIKVMPLSDVAVIGRVVMDRLASSIELSGSEIKAS